MNTCETVKNEMVNSQPGVKVDTFEKVVCTERSQAGDSNSATQTKNARSKPFSRAKNEVAGQDMCTNTAASWAVPWTRNR